MNGSLEDIVFLSSYIADKQIIMKKSNSQLINFILITVGGGFLLYEISSQNENVYFLIIGIVLLMFGLYRATNHWVYTKDDHKLDNENQNDQHE